MIELSLKLYTLDFITITKLFAIDIIKAIGPLFWYFFVKLIKSNVGFARNNVIIIYDHSCRVRKGNSIKVLFI